MLVELAREHAGKPGLLATAAYITCTSARACNGIPCASNEGIGEQVDCWQSLVYECIFALVKLCVTVMLGLSTAFSMLRRSTPSHQHNHGLIL